MYIRTSFVIGTNIRSITRGGETLATRPRKVSWRVTDATSDETSKSRNGLTNGPCFFASGAYTWVSFAGEEFARDTSILILLIARASARMSWNTDFAIGTSLLRRDRESDGE